MNYEDLIVKIGSDLEEVRKKIKKDIKIPHQRKMIYKVDCIHAWLRTLKDDFFYFT